MADDHHIEPTRAETGALAHAITRANGIAQGEVDRAPMVAGVLVDDDLVAWGDNEVHVDGDLSRHAEIVALANAAAEVGPEALRGAALVTTLQPCEMYLGAIGMAGITRLIYAAGRPDVKEDGFFTYSGLSLDDFVEAADIPLKYARNVMAGDVMHLYGPGGGDGTAA